MNWFEKVMNSDAGQAAPERARELVEQAGGSPQSSASPENVPVSEVPPAPESGDE